MEWSTLSMIKIAIIYVYSDFISIQIALYFVFCHTYEKFKYQGYCPATTLYKTINNKNAVSTLISNLTLFPLSQTRRTLNKLLSSLFFISYTQHYIRIISKYEGCSIYNETSSLFRCTRVVQNVMRLSSKHIF